MSRTGPSRQGEGVELRPFLPADMSFAYSVAARWPASWPRVCRRGLPNPHEFNAVVSYGVVSSWRIDAYGPGGAHPIGLVSLYDADERAGTVWLDNVGLPGDSAEAMRASATVRVISETFATGVYHKVYARYVGHQRCPLRPVDCPVHEEARLPQQVFYDGGYQDEVIAAVYRDEWLAEQDR